MKNAFERAADTADQLKTMLRNQAYEGVARLIKSFGHERRERVFDSFTSAYGHDLIIERDSNGSSFVEYAAGQKDVALLKILVKYCPDEFGLHNSDILERLYHQDEEMLAVVLEETPDLERSFSEMRSEGRFEVQCELDYFALEGRLGEASCFAESWLKKREIEGMIPR